MNHYAPVLIMTLNRYEHFRRCVESLSACTDSDKTDLYIAFDYPLNENHWEGYKKIEYYIRHIQGFKTVNIIKRNTNYGIARNFNDAMNNIFEKYDRVIFSEDDNEFSPNFLDYINKGLELFQNDPSVIAICGYNYPIVMPKDYRGNYYYCKAFSAWGYGGWKNKPLRFYYDRDEMINIMKNISYIKESLKYYELYNLYWSLTEIIHGRPRYGDGAVTISMLNDNKYCVFPSVSKIRNHGHDGSGIHGRLVKNGIYNIQKIDSDSIFIFTEGLYTVDKQIIKSIRKYFSLINKSKIKNYIIRLYYNLSRVKSNHNMSEIE